MEKKVRWLKNAVEVDLFKLSGLLQSKFSLDLRRADGKRKILSFNKRNDGPAKFRLALTCNIWGNTQIHNHLGCNHLEEEPKVRIPFYMGLGRANITRLISFPSR